MNVSSIARKMVSMPVGMVQRLFRDPRPHVSYYSEAHMDQMRHEWQEKLAAHPGYEVDINRANKTLAAIKANNPDFLKPAPKFEPAQN